MSWTDCLQHRSGTLDVVEIRPSPSARTVVVRLADDVPAQGLGELRSRLREVLAAGDARLVIDVLGLERLSSGVVAALLWTTRQCRARRIEVSVRGADGHAVLGRAGLGAVLDVEPVGRR